MEISVREHSLGEGSMEAGQGTIVWGPEWGRGKDAWWESNRKGGWRERHEPCVPENLVGQAVGLTLS